MFNDDDAIFIESLTYSHLSENTPALANINLSLPKGSRTLLIGANGAGKSTLLQILAGKRMTKNSDVRVLGEDVFRTSSQGVTYLGTEWAMNPVVRSDVVVSAFLDSVGGYRHKARRDVLLDILDVDLDWHMHAISDGERRRVQLVMGLMTEWDVLLLDEVTVDLDVLVRHDLLDFLKRESETRGATILCESGTSLRFQIHFTSFFKDATHIFDGLSFFPTFVAHMRFGTFVTPPVPWPLIVPGTHINDDTRGSMLHAIALQWLKEDRQYRKQEEETGHMNKTRGARRNQTVPNDSEIFYKKYDYAH